jgi:hypothetical protein
VPELVDPELVVPAPVPLEEDVVEDALAPEDAPPLPLVVFVVAPPVPRALEHAATHTTAIAKTTKDRARRG